MRKIFLKRFEKLEHGAQDPCEKKHIRICRRFEILEVGERTIQVAITDRITPHESAPAQKHYFLLCPYCGKENGDGAFSCSHCNHALQTRLADGYQKIPKLRRCAVCEAANQEGRKCCWFCGKQLSKIADRDSGNDGGNVIVLNLDGKEYKSTDPDLPPDVQALFGRIRRDGYDKRIVQEWLRERSHQRQHNTERISEQVDALRWELGRRHYQFLIGGIIVLIVVVILIGRFLLR